jgi:fido (protein-threonine AMPylation protein)
MSKGYGCRTLKFVGRITIRRYESPRWQVTPSAYNPPYGPNAIHAIREGNGRAQLTFFALLADRAGWSLDFDKLDPDTMLNAMISSFGGDEAELDKVIQELVS